MADLYHLNKIGKHVQLKKNISAKILRNSEKELVSKLKLSFLSQNGLLQYINIRQYQIEMKLPKTMPIYMGCIYFYFSVNYDLDF